MSLDSPSAAYTEKIIHSRTLQVSNNFTNNSRKLWNWTLPLEIPPFERTDCLYRSRRTRRCVYSRKVTRCCPDASAGSARARCRRDNFFSPARRRLSLGKHSPPPPASGPKPSTGEYRLPNQTCSKIMVLRSASRIVTDVENQMGIVE